MNRLVAQAFQPAGLPDFRVRWTRKGRLESRPHPQARKPALRTRLGSWSQCAPNMTWGLPMNRCSLAQVANLLSRRLLNGEALEPRTASGLAIRDTAQRGGGANQVAASILPAVEPGCQPGGRNAPHTANRREFSSNCPSTPRFRAAGCRPLRQPGWLPLRNSRDPRRFRPILIDSAVCATVANLAVVAQTALSAVPPTASRRGSRQGIMSANVLSFLSVP